MARVPEYIDIPVGATPIPTPREVEGPAAARPSMQANGFHAPNGTANGLPPAVIQAAFPPAASSSTTPKKPSISSQLTANVSDLVLSTILPPNLPTLPRPPHIHGRKRELTMQKSALGIPLMTANFRRFVTKVSWLGGGGI